MFLLPTGKIYTIRSLKSDEVYVGSTIQELSMRMGGHRADYKKGNILGKNKLIVENIEDWYIELYELYPCNLKTELKRREGEVIREIGTINKNIAGRTKNQYRTDHKEEIKQYYTDHKEEANQYQKQYNADYKEEIKQYKKQYRTDHKEEIKENQKQYYTDHKEEIKENQKQYYTDNKEEIKQYRTDHKEEIKQYKKQYRTDHKEENKQYQREYRIKKKLAKSQIITE